jgi:hypothetical protein
MQQLEESKAEANAAIIVSLLLPVSLGLNWHYSEGDEK